MNSIVIVCVLVAGASASPLRPVYSPQYAGVYYQGSVSHKQVLGSVYESTVTETTTQRQSEDDIKDAEPEPVEREDLEPKAVYYIYHPEGFLQRVEFLDSHDAENMKYTAQFRYENVEPITGPIYTFDPQTFELQQLQL